MDMSTRYLPCDIELISPSLPSINSKTVVMQKKVKNGAILLCFLAGLWTIHHYTEETEQRLTSSTISPVIKFSWEKVCRLCINNYSKAEFLYDSCSFLLRKSLNGWIVFQRDNVRDLS